MSLQPARPSFGACLHSQPDRLSTKDHITGPYCGRHARHTWNLLSAALASLPSCIDIPIRACGQPGCFSGSACGAAASDYAQLRLLISVYWTPSHLSSATAPLEYAGVPLQKTLMNATPLLTIVPMQNPASMTPHGIPGSAPRQVSTLRCWGT